MATAIRVDYQPVYFERWDLDITYVKTSDGMYFPVRLICEAMGLSPVNQLAKIRGDPILKATARDLPVPTDGGVQTMKCLPRRETARWFTLISPSHCKPAVREEFIEFQLEIMAEADRILFGDYSGVTRHAEHHGRLVRSRPIRGTIHLECPRCHAPLCLELEDGQAHLTVEDDD